VSGTAPAIRTINRAARLVESDPETAAAILRGEVSPSGAEQTEGAEHQGDDHQGDDHQGDDRPPMP
jgi:hypothetical protein